MFLEVEHPSVGWRPATEAQRPHMNALMNEIMIRNASYNEPSGQFDGEINISPHVVDLIRGVFWEETDQMTFIKIVRFHSENGIYLTGSKV